MGAPFLMSEVPLYMVSERALLHSHTLSQNPQPETPEREFSIDNPLVRIHLSVKMILRDRSCAMEI